jgi:cytoskeletal protein RodZ
VTAAGFRVRPIRSDSSIGDKLKRARTRKKISVAAVEEATKIRAKFILALESDSWEQIPSEVYGRGYLETYSHFLQLSVEAIMKQYDRERPSYAKKCQDAGVEFTPKSNFSLPRFLLTPRFFVLGVAFLLVTGVAGGIGMQVYKFISAPSLQLFTPVQAAEGGTQLVVHAKSVSIAGRASIGSAVQVNGKMVAVKEDGSFEELVLVQSGVNSIVVEADNGKKKTTEVLSVVATTE